MKKQIGLIVILLLTSLFTMNTAFSQNTEKAPKKTPEERAQKRSEKMSKYLSLTSEQQQKVYDIWLSHCTQADALRNSTTDKETRKSELKKLFESTDTQLQSVLTSEQLTKYNEMKEKMKEKRKNKHKNKNQY
jgi:periplasmic protein CpxP/Spy